MLQYVLPSISFLPLLLLAPPSSCAFFPFSLSSRPLFLLFVPWYSAFTSYCPFSHLGSTWIVFKFYSFYPFYLLWTNVHADPLDRQNSFVVRWDLISYCVWQPPEEDFQSKYWGFYQPLVVSFLLRLSYTLPTASKFWHERERLLSVVKFNCTKCTQIYQVCSGTRHAIYTAWEPRPVSTIG